MCKKLLKITIGTYELLIDRQAVTFELHRVVGDGACFFRTLGLALYGTQDCASTIRNDIVCFMVDNYGYYGSFITNHINGEPMTVEEYKAYMLLPGSYGTFVEVDAASTLFNRRIIVFQGQEEICDVGRHEWPYIVSMFSGNRDSGHFDLLWPALTNFPLLPLPYTPPTQIQSLSRPNIQYKLLTPKRIANASPIICTDNQTESIIPSLSNSLRRKAGRPKAVKRGRPKQSNLTKKEQNKRYAKDHPEVNRGATKRYAKDHPEVNRGSVQRYHQTHPQVHVDAAQQYRETHSDEIRTNKQVPSSIRKGGLIGEYSGSKLDNVKLYSFKQQSLCSLSVYTCSHCHAPLFDEEKGRKRWCCAEGAYIVPILPDLQANIYKLPPFLRQPRAYNNIFSFSALGVSHGFQHPKQGVSFLKIQGRTYHRVFDLAYTDTTNPCGMYIDDGEERARLAEGRSLNQSVVKAITDYLYAVNPYIYLLKQLSQEPSDDAHLIFEATTRRTHGPVLGDVPRGSEVAAVISTDRERYNPRQIVIWKIGSKKPHTVDVFHPLYESLQYPLLYPHGTPGWHIGLLDNKGKKLSQVKYYRRLLLSEPRFSQLGRLSEEWLVDMYCRVEEERLRFISRMQSKDSSSSLRSAPLNEIQETLLRDEHRDDVRGLGTDETIQGEGGIIPGRIYLPNTFTGGPRYMKTKYMDGMTIVSRLGKPSYFLTVTCNPKWPEITQSTAAGTKASAELVCRVFKLKLHELLRDLRCGAYFGRKMYILYVVEFQKRGLPHAHICYRVEGGGPRQNFEIDCVVRADIPSDTEANGRLKQLVLKHMLHGPCGPSHRTDLPCWDDKKKKCNKHFPKAHTETTHVDDRGFVHYRRDSTNTAEVTLRRKSVQVNDTFVVPYNAALLLKYDCHINLEIASTRKIIKYLFKYITKGPDEARVAVVPDTHNEVEMYVTKRYIGACDAAWRMLEFDLTGREPNVIQLPVHLEGQHTVVFHPGQEAEAAKRSSSNLLLYFSRPETAQFDRLSYLEFFEQYILHSRRPHTSIVPIIAHPDGVHYITKRQRGEMVARLFWISPNRGEQFYLRILLNNFPCRGYTDLINLGGANCMTFQAAARSLGLVNDELEYESALEEASRFMAGARLRRFFVLLLVAGVRGADLWAGFRDVLSEDLLERFSETPDRAYTMALVQIDRSLRRHGARLTDHGLPDVTDNSSELGRERLQYCIPQMATFVEEWLPKFSFEQRAVYDHVHRLVNESQSYDSCKAMFVDGPAGSGKTLLLNVLTSSLRSKNRVVLCTASSGIAAQNYEGGMTAHSMFKLPLDIDNDNAFWGITGGSQRAELIREATVIILDEAPMAHKNLIHVLERSLRDVMQSNEPFGSKIVIFAGDFRQIPPVVVGARTPHEVISASLRCSSLWPSITHFKLVEAQRTRGDSSYSEFLLQVGNGTLLQRTFGKGREKESMIALEGLHYVTELSTLIDSVFPELILSDPDACAKRALLCVTNENVDFVNSEILNKMSGDPVHLLSVNYVEDANSDDLFLSSDALGNVHARGVPDHNLVLKKNVVCMITRNLHFDDGLLNGTKVIIVGISPRLVTVRKPGQMDLYSIPRITFQAPVEPDSPLKMYRRQFPLRLSYAITVNKAQGQTIDFVGVDLRSDVFSHGQLYVALGRVRSLDTITVLVRPDRVFDDTAYVKNVVYPQLL